MTRPSQVYISTENSRKLWICQQLLGLKCKEEVMDIILDQYFATVPELKEILNATDLALSQAIQRRKQHDPAGSADTVK